MNFRDALVCSDSLQITSEDDVFLEDEEPSEELPGTGAGGSPGTRGEPPGAGAEEEFYDDDDELDVDWEADFDEDQDELTGIGMSRTHTHHTHTHSLQHTPHTHQIHSLQCTHTHSNTHTHNVFTCPERVHAHRQAGYHPRICVA